MRAITLFFIGIFFISCSSDQESEVVYLEANLEVAPLYSFLGTWDLESRIHDNIIEEPLQQEALFIEEDSINDDYAAVGHYDINGSIRDMIVQVDKDESVITLKFENYSLICDYDLLGDETLFMTEFWEHDGTYTITAWKKRI